MTEHGFLAAMLALVAFEVILGTVILGYTAYRVYRIGERTEGISAAIYLEVREVLSQPR